MNIKEFKWQQQLDFAMFAKACGGTGFTIDHPADCRRILEQALGTPGPVIVEAILDPYEPPMPAGITADQTLKFAKSLAKGQPKRMKIATTIAEDKIREVI